MLRITVREEENKGRIEAAGKIGGPWVAELENAWRSAQAFGKEIEVDLREVTGVDDAGRELLERMHREGTRLQACGVLMRHLVDEIAGGRRAHHKANRVAQIAGALILLHGLSLHAESAPPAVRPTLREAVNLTLQQNPQVAIANLNLAESQEGRTMARSALLPNASFDASESVNRGNLAAVLGTTTPGFTAHFGPFRVTQAGPQFPASLFDLSLWEKWRTSKEDVFAGAAQPTTAREQNAQLVVSQYLAGLRAEADVSAATSPVDLAKALLDLAADQQKSGAGIATDTLRANVPRHADRRRKLPDPIHARRTQRPGADAGRSRQLCGLRDRRRQGGE